MTNSSRNHLLRFYYSLTIIRSWLYYNTLGARYVNDRNWISGCSFASILLYTVSWMFLAMVFARVAVQRFPDDRAGPNGQTSVVTAIIMQFLSWKFRVEGTRGRLRESK